jgi:hypothetical protein
MRSDAPIHKPYPMTSDEDRFYGTPCRVRGKEGVS